MIYIYLVILIFPIIVVCLLKNLKINLNEFKDLITDLITVSSVLIGFLGISFGIISGVSSESKIGKALRKDQVLKKQFLVTMCFPSITGLTLLIGLPFIKVLNLLYFKVVLILYSIFILSFIILGYISIKVFYYDFNSIEKTDTLKVTGDKFKK